MRLKKYNKSIGMLSLIAATVLLSGCDMVLMNPKGAIGVEQRTLIITAIALMLIVVVPVIHGVRLCPKYRASNKDAKYSPNWAHSNKIEAVVWTIPIIIIAILGTITEDHPRTRPVQADCHRQEADDDRSGVARLEMAVHLPGTRHCDR